jgi:hypothetical protein
MKTASASEAIENVIAPESCLPLYQLITAFKSSPISKISTFSK